MDEASICNMALGEIGSRTLIEALNDSSTAARQCALFYTITRQQLLRAAPWGFARRTVTLTSLGLATDDPNVVPYPWMAMYAYPADCLGMRYILPPPLPPASGDAPDVSSTFVVPWCPPSRSWRYLKANDTSVDPSRTVILSNVVEALGVYTADVSDPDLFDPLFVKAFVQAMAANLVMPMSGNVSLKSGFVNLAKDALTEARARDGNESITTSDHVPDWIATREVGNYQNNWTYPFAGPVAGLGNWYWAYDSSWSM